MSLNRRHFMVAGTSVIALSAAAGLPAFASATDEMIATDTGGAVLGEGGISITAPEIAENGNTVPIDVDAPGASKIILYADGNPVPAVATYTFGPLAAAQSASTRIRLATSQNVVAIAQMADGSWSKASVPVKVTIGGCGG